MTDRASSEFRLKPGEDYLFAVGSRNGNLRFGPAGGALLWAAIGCAIGTFMGCVAFASENTGVGMRVVCSLLFAVVVANLVVTARARVEASPIGVTIRAPYRRRRRYAWSSIIDTRIVETEPQPFFRLSIRFGGGGGGGVRPDVDASKAYLVLDNGSQVQLPGFEAAARASGMSEGMETPSEIKVGALRRYREAVVGPW